MTRPTTLEDVPAIIALAEATGIFLPDGLDSLRAMLDECLLRPADSTKPFWLTCTDEGVCGVAYCEPERMTSGTWNLQLIAVHPARQRRRLGASLLGDIEIALRERHARILIVETSGQDEFEYVRRFYGRCGFGEEARIRDFYQAGDDKIIFRKSLV